MKSKGLGDTIEKFTKATGIKKLADKIPGGCGCNNRKNKLNEMFPYNKQIMAKDFPEIDKKNEGKFTRWVEKNMPGTTTCKAASKIMRSKKKYSPSVVKMANYAKNFGCSKK